MEDKTCHKVENSYCQIPPEAGKNFRWILGNKHDYDIKGGTHIATSNFVNTECLSRLIRTDDAIDFSDECHNSKMSYDLKSGTEISL